MSHEPPANCDDPNTWNHKDQSIDLGTLLALIEAHGGTRDLDLHGCEIMFQDLSYQALLPYLQQWRGAQPPPWVFGTWGIRLEGVHLEHAKLTGSRLSGADLSWATLHHAFLFSTNLDDASFVRAKAHGVSIFHASATKTGFQNSDLTQANLMATDFRDALFAGANLQRAQLLDAHLEGVDLRLTDLRGAMLHGVRLEKTKLRPANVRWQVGEELVASGRQQMHYSVGYFEAADVYQDLKANFAAIGYYDAASWAYVKEKQMEKMAYFQEWRPKRVGARLHPLRWLSSPVHTWRRFWRWLRIWITHPGTRISFWRWLRNWAYELATGYGERPLNPVIGGAIAIVVFAAGYFFSGAIGNFGDALAYSLATFATFNLADLQPQGRGVDIASSVEALLGIAVLALVVFTLGNRMSRS